MKLRLVVFGLELARIELDLPEPAPALSAVPVVARGVKWLSNKWLEGMTR